MLNAIELNGKLEEIGRQVGTLLDRAWIGGQGDLTPELTRVWNVTCELQRALCAPSIIEGYRADAVAQVHRVRELIEEAGPDPDHRQLLSLGLATELAVKKLNDYRKMVNLANMTRATAGTPDGMVELAA